jgi:hypothetical protein
MWYDGGPTTVNIGRIGRATSTDGIHWTKDDLHNPILDMGTAGQWDQGSLAFPRVFVVRDTMFMCYTCVKSNGSWRAIGLARSTDGGTLWQKIGTGPILSPTAYSWDQSYVQEGFVLPMGNELYMWYFGMSLGANKGSIGIATSPNPGALLRVPQNYKTIQAAIDAAFDGDTVLVSEGTYTENIVLTKKITVGSLFVVDGDTAHVARTVIDGSKPHTLDSAAVVTIDGNTDTTTVLAGFTITGGKGNWTHVNWPPIVYDMRLGTGVDVAGGGAHIHHNIIRANNVNDPNNCLGAVVNVFDASDKNGISYVVVDHNTVSDNVLIGYDCEGGAVAVIHDASIHANIIERNIARGDSAGGYGAALLIQNGTVKVDGNLIVGNSASQYGGAFVINSVDEVDAVPHVTLTNNIVANNSCGMNGGGMWVGESDVLVAMINNTFASNTADSGSGVVVADGATVRGLNTIFWDPGKAETLVNGNLILSYCDVRGGYPGTGNIDAIPGFVPGDPMYNLDPTSYCIGRGIDSIQIGDTWYCMPPVDFDGHPRHRPPGSQQCDIGAQEEQITIDVPVGGAGLPAQFALEQNYPNPFNPSTVISYQLPVVSNVKLAVCDILGREVAVLVNERKNPGSYEVKFDGSRFASGVYFYRIQAQDFTQVKRLLLLK